MNNIENTIDKQKIGNETHDDGVGGGNDGKDDNFTKHSAS